MTGIEKDSKNIFTKYKPIVYPLTKNGKQSILDSSFDILFSNNIAYPELTLGFNHFIHRAKDSTEITNTGEYKAYGCTAKGLIGTHNKYDFEGDNYLLFAKSGGNHKTIYGDNLGIGKFHKETGYTAGNVAVMQFVNISSYSINLIYMMLKYYLYEIFYIFH